MKKQLAALALLATLTGCAGPATPAPTPKPTTPHTYYGENAATLAGLIPGCKNPRQGDVMNNAASGIASTANCTLDGRDVSIISWTDSTSQSTVYTLFASNGQETWYASSEGWTISVGAYPDLPGEKAGAETVAAALGGTVVHIPAS